MFEKTQRRKITKPLPVKLADEEVLKYGRDAARAVADKARIEDEFSSVKAEYKAKISEQDSIVGKLSPRIHSGIETREVECEEMKNWTAGTVLIKRIDSGETIEKRPMREDEKQMEVSLDDGDDGADEVEYEIAPPSPVSDEPAGEEEETGDTTSNPFA